MRKLLLRVFAALFLALSVAPAAQAAVTITFWSHEFGTRFPHAFFTLRGVPDAGGPSIDRIYGFTARSVSPALLFGSVPGRVEPEPPGYVASSDAQFSVVLTDVQYGQVLALIAAWDEHTGDGHYNLNRRNCIHFVKEAARIAGLTGLDQPRLMKRPRSYLLAVQAANAGHVVAVNRHGDAYLAALPPVEAAQAVASATPADPAVAVPAAPVPPASQPAPAPVN
ncbi:hypothetical protein [Sphingomonas sp.]|uniref:hypothetical protein n=1 Tax=Sphingomonas sp. TaxID=28214 RepID=UPI003CC6B243